MCVTCGCGCGPWWGHEGLGYGYSGPGSSWGSPRYVGRNVRLRWLEDHQRDLEQEAADVADAIRRLQEEPEA